MRKDLRMAVLYLQYDTYTIYIYIYICSFISFHLVGFAPQWIVPSLLLLPNFQFDQMILKVIYQAILNHGSPVFFTIVAAPVPQIQRIALFANNLLPRSNHRLLLTSPRTFLLTFSTAPPPPQATWWWWWWCWCWWWWWWWWVLLLLLLNPPFRAFLSFSSRWSLSDAIVDVDVGRVLCSNIASVSLLSSSPLLSS